MMDMTIRPMTPQERLYTYDQSGQINGQTQCVGHLRADLSNDGKKFFSNWTDHVRTLNTKEFKDDFNALINALRFDEKYGGMLKDRRSLAAFCGARADGSFDDNSGNYGFRVDAEDYAYMLRLNARPDMYSLYCYCYVAKSLDYHIRDAQRGIRFITPRYKELFRIPDGDLICIRSPEGKQIIRQCRYIDQTHVEVGSNLYHICEFAERMESAHNTVIPLRSSLPVKCHIYIESTKQIAVVLRGESGYHQPVSAAKSKEESLAIVDMVNTRNGITKAQAAAMSAGSMFGWATPAADPANYDEQGRAIKPKHIDRGDAR